MAIGLTISPAQAQDVPEDKAAEAERLFDEGRRLMMEPGQLDRSCETLAKSLALMERGDTYLNLAECHRRQGKTATAWREFGEALRHAKTVEFKEAIETAKTIRADLEAKLSRLTVKVPKATADVAELKIELNGEALPREKWGTAMVLDPQSYTVTASGKGQKPFTQTVELGDDKDVKEIVVTLEPVPAPKPTAPAPEKPKPEPPPPPPPSGGGVHPVAIAGFVVAGLGFVGYGITGGMSIAKRSDFDEDCPDDLCPPGSEDDIDQAILLADLSTVFLITGVVGAGVGVFGLLYFDGDDGDDSAVRVDVGPGSLSLRGTF